MICLIPAMLCIAYVANTSLPSIVVAIASSRSLDSKMTPPKIKKKQTIFVPDTHPHCWMEV